MSNKNGKINSIIDNNFLTVNDLVNSNTIVGTPITTISGFQVIPFSKITIGNLSGGGEYGNDKIIKQTDEVPFAGGAGSVISMKPMGFIIDDGKTCRITQVSMQPIDNLIEKATEIIRDITK